MKVFTFLLLSLIVAGCNVRPSLDSMNEQSRSGLSLAASDSVELDEWYIKKWVWDFHSPRYQTILYFEDSAYQTILRQAVQDSNYGEIREEEQKQKLYEIYFEPYLVPPPDCSMQDPAYLYAYEYRAQFIYRIFVFCNRVYFTRGNIVLD